MDYFFHILILIGIYATLASSLDLVAGHAGLLSLAHAAFFGVGAYTSALLATSVGAPFIISFFAALAFGALAGLAASVPALRSRDDYFVIATFGIQMICFSIFQNWIEITRGPLGISGIAKPSVLGVGANSQVGVALISISLAVLSQFLLARLTTSPFGRVLRSIREEESFAQSLGKDTLRFKVVAFTVSASFAAAAGSLYAHYMTYIDPSSFTVLESILIVSMVVIGGAGSTFGPIVGAIVLIALPEILRLVGLPSSEAANLRQILYGAMLVAMMILRPRGLVGRYDFGG